MISTLVLFGILPVTGVTIIVIHIVSCMLDHREINNRLVELEARLKEIDNKLDRLI